MASLKCIFYIAVLFDFQYIFAEHATLSFFGHDLSVKKPLLDIPIISDTNYNFNTNRKLLTNNETNKYPVTLTISPSQLTTPDGFELITITWTGAIYATSGDYIAIYSPINSSNEDYLDYFYNINDEYVAEINGTHQFVIWNMRDNYQIRYFYDNNGINYQLLGISNIATVNAHQPLQGHLSLTKHSPNQMQIRWVSSFISCPMVQLGITSRNYTKTLNATYYTYNTSRMCGSSASIISPKQFRDPGYIYTAIMDELDSNTQYFYRFGNMEYWSDEQTFITSSTSMEDIKSKSFGFIMYGDQGTTESSFKHIDAVKNEIDNDIDIGLILHIGDLSYAWGNGYNWDKWSNMISRVAMNVPYMISIGNHEYCHYEQPNDGGLDVSGVGGSGYHPKWGNFHDDSFGECAVPSYYRFDAEICDDGNSIFWYSFNYNSIHFVILSSEHNYSVNTDGYRFLVNDLRNNINHTLTPWIIVGIHRPLYQSEIYPDDNLVDAHLLELLEPIFYEYNVDIVLAGHYHSYERTCAVYNYSCIGHENGGIVHLTMGAAGFLLDSAEYTPNQYILFRNEKDFGYGRFAVNYTHLIAQYVIINDQKVIDQVILRKNNKTKQKKVINDTISKVTSTQLISDNDGIITRNKQQQQSINIGAIIGVLAFLCVVILCYLWYKYKNKRKMVQFKELISDDDDDFDSDDQEKEEEKLQSNINKNITNKINENQEDIELIDSNSLAH